MSACMCGADDCPRCHPENRMMDTDYDPEPEGEPTDAECDDVAARWENEREAMIERYYDRQERGGLTCERG